MSTRLKFDPEKHVYRLDGKRVPSVTTIVAATQAKPHLVAWAAKMAAQYAVENWADLGGLEPADRVAAIKGAADRARDAAALSGTQVHALAETLLQGHQVDVPADQVAKVRTFAGWWASSGFRAVHTEVRVHGHGFAGTFDCAATDEWGHLWLLDWKTGRAVYPEMAVQLAGYAAATAWVVDGEDVPADAFTHHAVVHLQPDRVALYQVPDRYRAAERWDAALSLYTSPKPGLMEVVA